MERSHQEFNEKLKSAEKPTLKEDRSFEFCDNERRGRWLFLEKGEMSVEGAYYQSEKPNSELIIFIPGMPGDGVAWFEDKQLAALLEDGYDVFVCRHGGVKPNEDTRRLIHNKARFDRGTTTGSGEMRISEWAQEPKLILEFFSDRPTIIISHSIGGLMVANSLIGLARERGDAASGPATNTKKWLNLSGATFSRETFDEAYSEKWRQFFENRLQKYCLVNDPGKEFFALESAFLEVTDGLSDLTVAEVAAVISVYPKDDEYVGIKGATDLHDGLGRGVILRDETVERVDLPASAEIHDFPHMLPQTLLRLVKMKTSERRRTAILKNKEPVGRHHSQ